MGNLDDGGDTGTYASEADDLDTCVGAFSSNPFTGIPVGATIDGITVEVFSYSGDGDDQIDVAIYNETDETYTADKDGTPPAGIENAADVTYGGSADKWGTTWTRDDIIHANFRVRLTKDSVTKADTVFASRAQVTVTYTATSSYTVTKTSDMRFLKAQQKDIASDIRYLKVTQIDKTSDILFLLTSQIDKLSDTRFLGETTIQKNSDIRYKTTYQIDKTSDCKYAEAGAGGQNRPVSPKRGDTVHL